MAYLDEWCWFCQHHPFAMIHAVTFLKAILFWSLLYQFNGMWIAGFDSFKNATISLRRILPHYLKLCSILFALSFLHSDIRTNKRATQHLRCASWKWFWVRYHAISVIISVLTTVVLLIRNHHVQRKLWVITLFYDVKDRIQVPIAYTLYPFRILELQLEEYIWKRFCFSDI